MKNLKDVLRFLEIFIMFYVNFRENLGKHLQNLEAQPPIPQAETKDPDAQPPIPQGEPKDPDA